MEEDNQEDCFSVVVDHQDDLFLLLEVNATIISRKLQPPNVDLSLCFMAYPITHLYYQYMLQYFVIIELPSMIYSVVAVSATAVIFRNNDDSVGAFIISDVQASCFLFVCTVEPCIVVASTAATNAICIRIIFGRRPSRLSSSWQSRCVYRE